MGDREEVVAAAAEAERLVGTGELDAAVGG
jgi:hypothetical protein